MYIFNRVLLYINTIKHLKPTQIFYQVINRICGNRKIIYAEKVRKVTAPKKQEFIYCDTGIRL